MQANTSSKERSSVKNSMNNATKSSPATENISQTKILHTNNANPKKELDNILEKLIHYFKPTESQTTHDASQKLGDSFSESTNTDLHLVSPHYLESYEPSDSNFYQIASYAKSILNKCNILYVELEKNCKPFDFLVNNVALSGYRILLRVFDNACTKMLNVVSEINSSKKNPLFKIFKIRTSHLKSKYIFFKPIFILFSNLQTTIFYKLIKKISKHGLD